ncbi:MAG: choice-of-anchor V domain-containing protein [Blastocatellia bacterium]
MKKRNGRLAVLKLSATMAAAVVAIAGFWGVASDFQKTKAASAGPSPGHTSAPGEANCTACHVDFPTNSGSGNVTLTGIPANYLPGQQIPVTVRVSQVDGVVYGFQFTAIDSTGTRVGSYTLPNEMPPNLQLATGFINNIERRYVFHTSNGIIPGQFGFHQWTFTWNAPAARAGKVSFYVAGNAANSDGSTAGDHIYTTSGATLSGTAISNFDVDTRSDVAVFRPSTNIWYSLNSTNGAFQAIQFGAAGDRIVPGDYDGDGKTDQAVWRPSTGVWYVQRSSGGFAIVQFGSSGDIPVSGDYDGDLKSDIAVWRPSTGVWYILKSSDGGFDIRQFGIATDKTAQADFDADGKTDIAVFRPADGTWYIWRSRDNGFSIFGFGLNGDRPVQGDYDGDGRADAAVYRPSNGVWYMLRSTAGFGAVQFGIATDIPTPGDFDGDGKYDNAVYRDGVWYIFRSSDAGFNVYSFGLTGDIPIPAGYIAE